MRYQAVCQSSKCWKPMYKRLLPELLLRTVSLAKQVSSYPRKRFDTHQGAYSLPSLQCRHKAKVAAASKALQQHQTVLENTLQSSYDTEMMKRCAYSLSNSLHSSSALIYQLWLRMQQQLRSHHRSSHCDDHHNRSGHPHQNLHQPSAVTLLH